MPSAITTGPTAAGWSSRGDTVTKIPNPTIASPRTVKATMAAMSPALALLAAVAASAARVRARSSVTGATDAGSMSTGAVDGCEIKPPPTATAPTCREPVVTPARCRIGGDPQAHQLTGSGVLSIMDLGSLLAADRFEGFEPDLHGIVAGLAAERSPALLRRPVPDRGPRSPSIRPFLVLVVSSLVGRRW